MWWWKAEWEYIFISLCDKGEDMDTSTKCFGTKEEGAMSHREGGTSLQWEEKMLELALCELLKFSQC